MMGFRTPFVGRTAGAIAVLAGVVCGSGSLHGQEEPERATAPSEELSTDQVQARLKQLDEQTDIDEATKAKAKELYQTAIQELETIKTLETSTGQWEKQIQDAAARTEKAKSDRSALPEKPATVTVPAGLTLSELEQELSKKEQTAKEKSEELAKRDSEPKRRATRLAEMPALLKEAQQLLTETEAQLALKPPPNEPPALTEAKRTLNLVRKRRANLAIAALNREQAEYEATDEAIQIERDIAASESAAAEQEAKVWREEVNRRRKAEAQQQLQKAQMEEARVSPAVEDLAKNNSALAKERIVVADNIAKADEQLEAARNTLDEVSTEYDRTKTKVEAVGLSHASGQLLREQRARLPDVRQHRRNMHLRESTLAQLRFDIYRYDDRRSDLGDLDAQVERVVTKLSVAPTEPLRRAVREMLEKEREYLDGLTKDYQAYQSKLQQLDAVEEELIDTTEEYGRYIDGHVVWIRSTFALSALDIGPGMDALRWMVSPQGWLDVADDLTLDIRQYPLVSLAFLAGFIPLVWLQRRFRSEISTRSEVVGRRGHARFGPTMEVLVLTVAISIVWPGLLLYVGWRLHSSLEASEFARAVAGGLITTAKILFPLELLRQICRSSGLAEAHFGWPAPALRLLRQHLRRLILSGLPLVYVIAATETQTIEPLWSSSLGRVAFIVFLVLLFTFCLRTLRPTAGPVRQMLAYQHDGWAYRLRYIWYPIIAASPLLLAVLAGVGFYDTALMLAARLFETIWVFVGLAVLSAVLRRWVLIVRRRLAIEQARQRREAAQAEAAAAREAGTPEPGRETEGEVDLASISGQTQKLIRTILFVAGVIIACIIWADIVPALNILKTVPLWPGAAVLTLGDLFMAVATLIVTYFAVRDIPGLVEFAVLQNLPLDTGARYACATVCRYLLIMIGVAIAGHFVGITWSSIQWLIAALSIGLGFGLQEIFANFVSGIILLIERPIRVGDIVTLGETTGKVSRIRIRATTITDWDRKEYVVPNKDLITGRLLNWTLSDQTNRVVVQVGVAYGSDTEQARELLLKVAHNHPLILDDPAPSAVFDMFGDSTLNLTLRCYLPNLDSRLNVIHELHTAIDRAYRDAGIEIAFPQRDIHVRSIQQPIPAPGVPASQDVPYP